MEYRITQKAEKSITIEIPIELQGKELEVIIKEIDPLAERRKQLQEILLKGPTWTDEQYKSYLESRKHLEKWNQS
ncbi:MAG: hypothetical protein HC913_09045 [Microscillaceae bacterium]|nr:hypothetical protein [Microscillaceae bacterium]